MRLIAWSLALAGALCFSGCGRGDKPAEALEVDSPLNQGPRAAEAPVNGPLAETGRDLFKSKTCSSCHAFGARLIGPDLTGVTQRRSVKWMEKQIMHPDVMILEDPITIDLFEKYTARMPNLMLTQVEAGALIEYLKYRDREAEPAASTAAR